MVLENIPLHRYITKMKVVEISYNKLIPNELRYYNARTNISCTTDNIVLLFWRQKFLRKFWSKINVRGWNYNYYYYRRHYFAVHYVPKSVAWPEPATHYIYCYWNVLFLFLLDVLYFSRGHRRNTILRRQFADGSLSLQ